MKTSELLRQAAKYIEKNVWADGGCYTIEQILWDGNDKTSYTQIAPQWKEAVGYLRRMAPAKAAEGRYWFGVPTCGEQEIRILALCFAAVLAEEDGR